MSQTARAHHGNLALSGCWHVGCDNAGPTCIELIADTCSSASYSLAAFRWAGLVFQPKSDNRIQQSSNIAELISGEHWRPTLTSYSLLYLPQTSRFNCLMLQIHQRFEFSNTQSALIFRNVIVTVVAL
jgi:hypothetical protein